MAPRASAAGHDHGAGDQERRRAATATAMTVTTVPPSQRHPTFVGTDGGQDQAEHGDGRGEGDDDEAAELEGGRGLQRPVAVGDHRRRRRRARSRLRLTTAVTGPGGVDPREGVVGHRAAEEGAELGPALTLGEAEHEQGVGPVGEVRPDRRVVPLVAFPVERLVADGVPVPLAVDPLAHGGRAATEVAQDAGPPVVGRAHGEDEAAVGDGPRPAPGTAGARGCPARRPPPRGGAGPRPRPTRRCRGPARRTAPRRGSRAAPGRGPATRFRSCGSRHRRAWACPGGPKRSAPPPRGTLLRPHERVPRNRRRLDRPPRLQRGRAPARRDRPHPPRHGRLALLL